MSRYHSHGKTILDIRQHPDFLPAESDQILIFIQFRFGGNHFCSIGNGFRVLRKCKEFSAFTAFRGVSKKLDRHIILHSAGNAGNNRAAGRTG